MIEDIEFFSSAPEQGHWPVLFDIDIPVKYDNPKPCVLIYKMANWEGTSIQLENNMVQYKDSMINEAPMKALLTFNWHSERSLRKFVSTKNTLRIFQTILEEQIDSIIKNLKVARKKYRLQCNPKNKIIVEIAKIEFRKEMKKNNTRWAQNYIIQ